MLEFIVWDHKKKEFDYNFLHGKNQAINDFFMFFELSRYWSIFNYIGKTDIEGNKIYAESSIVNVDVNIGIFNAELNGYFKYYKSQLGYNFHKVPFDKTSPYNIIAYNDDSFRRLRIVGTLQENPELLGENK